MKHAADYKQLQETSKRKILQMCAIQDEMMEESANSAADR